MAKLTGKSKEMADEIQAVLKKYGYVTTRYFVSMDATTSRLTINVNNPAQDGAPVSKNAIFENEYLAKCLFHGFEKSWLGKNFDFCGRRVTLVGFRPGRSSKFVVYSHNGKMFVTEPFSFQTVLAAAMKQVG
jgi:hypothetical protein